MICPTFRNMLSLSSSCLNQLYRERLLTLNPLAMSLKLNALRLTALSSSCPLLIFMMYYTKIPQWAAAKNFDNDLLLYRQLECQLIFEIFR